MSSRNYCFTYHGKFPEDFRDLDFSLVPQVRYAVWQLELSASGKHHYQGYVELSSPGRFTCLHPAGLDGAHFEKRRGTRDQARDYCRKEDTRVDGPFEYGEWGSGGSGTRNDLASLKALIDSGADLKKVCDDDFANFLRYGRGVQLAILLRDQSAAPRSAKSVTRFIYGPAGCGKSRRARELAGPDAFWKPLGDWWDGYTGQSTVVLDDFAGNFMSYTTWKHVCDQYPLKTPIKGGMVNFTSSHVIITSTKLPHAWWSEKVPVDIQEVSRRIDIIDYWDHNHKTFVTATSDEQAHALDKIPF